MNELEVLRESIKNLRIALTESVDSEFDQEIMNKFFEWYDENTPREVEQ